MSSADPEHRDEENEPAAADDEDTGAQVAPIVRLEEVAVSTGEEDEDPILDLKSKLYRFDKEGNQWKERGAGTVKFLKHKVTGKVRLLMRQSKTLKICANHLILPTMSVQEHAGNEKSCVWHARDFADGELKDELFCIRFPSIESSCSKRANMILLKDIAPAAQNNIDTKFILLEKGRTTLEGQNKACLALVADETAAVHFQLWGDECDAFEAGDIIYLTNGIFSYQRSNLVLRAGKKGKVEKIGEFTMSYVETPNMSEIQWIPDPNNSKKYIQEYVISPQSRIFPPTL